MTSYTTPLDLTPAHRPDTRRPVTSTWHNRPEQPATTGKIDPVTPAGKSALARLQTEGLVEWEIAGNPVFILGSPRSGTSALAEVLWQVGYNGFGEGHFLSFIHYFEAVVDQHYVRFAEPPDPGVMLGNIDKDDLKRRLFATFRTVVDDLNQAEPWFDKTADPGMILASPMISGLFPGSAFVFAKRRGIENVMSRVKKFPGESFENHCAGWAGSMRVWRKVRELLPPGSFIEVEQRDMIQQPQQTARDLCAFLEVKKGAVAAASHTMSTEQPGGDLRRKRLQDIVAC